MQTLGSLLLSQAIPPSSWCCVEVNSGAFRRKVLDPGVNIVREEGYNLPHSRSDHDYDPPLKLRFRAEVQVCSDFLKEHEGFTRGVGRRALDWQWRASVNPAVDDRNPA